MTTPAAPAPRRVVLVEGNRDGTVGGSFQCLHDVARHLDRSRYEPVAVFWEANRFADALRGAGIEVHLWLDRCPEEGTRGPGRSFAARAARLARAIGARRTFLRAVRAGLVHLNNMPELGYDDWLPASRLLGIPIVAHARAEASRDLGSVARRLAGSFDRIIAISRHVAESLLRTGTPQRRVVQIYDGIDIDAVRAGADTKENVRQTLGISPEAFLILMAGNLKRWKGQHVLLEALARMPAPGRARCQAILAGGTPAGGEAYEMELRALAARHNLTGQVHLLGSRDDVPALMNAADAIVHASVQPEPFGLVVVEAMALGKPVVASNLGGPSETVTPGTGLLFDPDDPAALAHQLQALLDQPSLRRTLGEQARQRAEVFSIQRNVAAIERLYGELLGMHTATPVEA